jgi:P27 family predicted phage terminase small subunit
MGGKSTGRTVKPTAIKKAQGTLRKDRKNDKEPEFAIVKAIPDPPEYFTDKAREIYYSTGLDLINQGILTSVGFPQFIIYCTTTASVFELTQLIKEQGYFSNFKGQRVQNQNIKSLKTFADLSRQLANEFGLTPASSSKIIVDKKPKSELDEYI